MSLKVPDMDGWLSEHLSATEKQTYLVLMQARYGGEAYPVDLGDLSVTLQYANKHKATELLKKRFSEGTDYVEVKMETDEPGELIISGAEQSGRSVTPRGEQSGRGGQNIKHYALTVHAAQEFALMSKTEKGKEIRAFFIKLVAVLQDYHMLTVLAAERKKQLQDRHDVLMEQFKKDDPVWYWVLVDQRDGYNVYKAGWTDDIRTRYDGWKRDYPMCYVRHVIRVSRNRVMEKKFQNHPVAGKYRFSEMMHGHEHRELYRVDQEFTEEEAIRIAKKIAESLLTDQEGEWRHEERLKAIAEKTKQVALMEKTKVTVGVAKEKTRQLRLKLQLERVRKGLDPGEISESEDEAAVTQVHDNDYGDHSESEPEEDPDEDRIAVSAFVESFVGARVGGVISWTAIWKVFLPWWQKRFPHKQPRNYITKTAARLLFDEQLKGKYTTHRDKFTNKTPLGWKDYYLVPPVVADTASESGGPAEQSSASAET